MSEGRGTEGESRKRSAARTVQVEYPSTKGDDIGRSFACSGAALMVGQRRLFIYTRRGWGCQDRKTIRTVRTVGEGRETACGNAFVALFEVCKQARTRPALCRVSMKVILYVGHLISLLIRMPICAVSVGQCLIIIPNFVLFSVHRPILGPDRTLSGPPLNDGERPLRGRAPPPTPSSRTDTQTRQATPLAGVAVNSHHFACP